VRAAEGAFVAEGMKVVAAALDAGAPVESLYLAPEGLAVPAVNALAERALAIGARVFDLGPGIMERVADTVTPQPVCAVVGDITRPLGDVLAAPAVSGSRLLLVCVDIRDPGNLGALIRSASGAGADAIVCCEGTADPFNPKTVRATAGTVFDLPIVIAGSPLATFEALRARGVRLLATTAHEGEDYAIANLSGSLALVLGNESSGLPPDLLALVDEKVTIPMARETESLNVAMTATVLCFEIARRLRLA
jgi:TrmH family RNA methyltransferase